MWWEISILFHSLLPKSHSQSSVLGTRLCIFALSMRATGLLPLPGAPALLSTPITDHQPQDSRLHRYQYGKYLPLYTCTSGKELSVTETVKPHLGWTAPKYFLSTVKISSKSHVPRIGVLVVVTLVVCIHTYVAVLDRNWVHQSVWLIHASWMHKYPQVSNYATHHTNKNITDLHQSLALFGYLATACKSLRTKSPDTIIVQQAVSLNTWCFHVYVLTDTISFQWTLDSLEWKLERWTRHILISTNDALYSFKCKV